MLPCWIRPAHSWGRATPLRQIIPARYADAQMWVRHALTAEADGRARVRTTNVDNAPAGRELHWSSVFIWLIRGAAALHHRLTADGWPGSLEQTLLWFNAPLFGVVVIVISSWCVRCFGLAAGVLSAAVMMGSPRFYEGFAPAYVDHHGVITAACLLLLGAMVVMTARPTWGGCGVAVLTVLCFGLAGQRVVVGHNQNVRHVVAAGDLLQPLYRDVAAVLRSSHPDGEITILASPNASAGISYFGDFKSLGTLFWENASGLRAAAEIFSAVDETEARRRIQERGVTHVVLISAANFLGEYFQLLHPTRDIAEGKRSFGYRLLANPADPPRWLQPIPFRRTPELAQAGGGVALFRVVPDQSEAERLFHAGAAEAAAGKMASAEELFMQARAQTPREEQAAVSIAAAEMLYEFGGDAAAVRMFRAALGRNPDPHAVTTLAWILATTADDALRDGREALAVVHPLLKDYGNDPLVLSAVAAAYAESGRFAEGVPAAERALGLVRASGDRAAVDLLEKRLATYRANRPWRQ